MTTTHHVPAARPGSFGFTTRGLRDAGRRAGVFVVFGLVPAALLTFMLAKSFGNHFAFDFHQFWQGGRDVVDGRSPYPASVPAGGNPALDPVEIQDVFRFPYPAPAALALAPFGALPFTVAAAIFVAASLAAVFAALRVLGVRDWRCYGVAFASITTLGALRLGTFTPLLLLGLALAWRYRDRRAVAACAVAALVMAKLFLWPVLVWLVLTRRFATAAVAAAVAAVVTIGSWAVLGFAGMGDYPNVLSSLSASVQAKGWSVVALGLSLGLSAATAKLAAVVLACSVLGAALFLPRARRDLGAFTLAIVAALLLSPIVWLHYFLLLLAPLAIAAPALSPLWFVPLLFWAWPYQETGGGVWQICLGLTVLAALTAATLRRAPRVRA